jgi:hypothetical protein
MKKILSIVCAVVISLSAKAQMVAIKTDLAMDACMAPPLGMEIVTGNKTTFGVNFVYAWKGLGKNIEATVIQPEFRYYLSHRPVHGIFMGLGAIGGRYSIEWKNKTYRGDAVGGGLTFGYVYNITPRLSLDFHAGYGAIYYNQKENFVGSRYDQDSSNNGITQANANGYYLLPTRIGISISYVLK